MEALTKQAGERPIQPDVGDTALDRNRYIKAPDLKSDSEVKVLFLYALETLVFIAYLLEAL